jgi:hypothetical protein
MMLYVSKACRLTAGVTGKGGVWQKKPPDAESAVWGRFPESAGKAPHLSSTTCQPSFAWLFLQKTGR